MRDLIERQKAIDDIKRDRDASDMPEEWYKGIDYAIDHLIHLPSAQPEMNMDEWCTDCKEYDHEKHCCPRWNRVIRQTLKDALPIYCQDCKNYLTPYCSCFQQSRDNWYCADGERKEDGE